MTTKNPFPGMNPFFEQQWRDAHATLLIYFRDALQERLPADLVIRTEEEAVTVAAGQPSATYRPDIQVRDPWTLKEPVAGVMAASPPAIAATEPIRVFLEEEIERWLEIRDSTGRLITVIELLSPTNKLEAAERERYLRKRRSFISGGANVVEIDLVRQGKWVFVASIQHVLREAGATYAVCVFCPALPAEQQVYPIPLRDRLPVIRVPLRPTDSEPLLDLQPLIDQCHERGRYHSLNYRMALDPALSPGDAVWAEELLRRQQLL